ncbi:heavy-metal-associated domain-containing protein [Flavobacterium sp. ZS1P14]|uniref:heavy-metal-associated domain-containing protein n=1 Tax=Flavobacterium sp. ZS1P14 TaxID=3401729 RepID=UPI003AAD57CB
MKKFNLKTIIGIVLIMTVSLKSHSQVSKVEIVATGLTCSMCSKSINNQLKTVPEVDSIAINLNTNTFIIFPKKGNTINPGILKERVEKAGFFVGSMIITISFDNLKIENNFAIEKDGLSLIFVDTKTKILNGKTKLKIVDKGFITQKEYKKNIKNLSKYPSDNMNHKEEYHLITI